MTEELKPCPFCDCDMAMKESVNYPSPDGRHEPTCPLIDLDIAATEEEWNTRATLSFAHIEDEREAFEAEATRLGVYTCDFVRYDETTAHCYNRDNGDLITVSVGDYRSATLQDCWKMWQARAALSAPPASEQQRAVVMPEITGTAIVEVVSGVEGPSLYIGDEDGGYRLAGPKPWGGGKTIHKFTVKLNELVREAMNLAAPSQGGEA